MIKSKVNKICTKDSKWLRHIVSVTNKNGSNIFQGKCLVIYKKINNNNLKLL